MKQRRGATQVVSTSFTLGIQFDDYDYRLFLREYHRDLEDRFPDESVPDYNPNDVLDELIPRFEPVCEDGVAGGRYEALQQFARRVHRLDLNITGSDFGPFEQRRSPYSFDRTYYHLGHEIVTAEVKMEYPGYNAYRSTRRLSVDFIRDNVDDVLELVPDYLWWSMHDQKEVLTEALTDDEVAEVTRRIELAGYKTENFGLYLTTMETLHMES